MVTECSLENVPGVFFTIKVIKGSMILDHYQIDEKGARRLLPTAQNVLCSI